MAWLGLSELPNLPITLLPANTLPLLVSKLPCPASVLQNACMLRQQQQHELVKILLATRSYLPFLIVNGEQE